MDVNSKKINLIMNKNKRIDTFGLILILLSILYLLIDNTYQHQLEWKFTTNFIRISYYNIYGNFGWYVSFFITNWNLLFN